jgi:bacterioferritin
MQGNPEVIAALEAAAAREAQLNLQYRQDWRSIKFMGAKKTARKLKRFGSDAHDWLKELTDRVLFLGGRPSYSIPAIAEQPNFTEVLKNELALEMAIIAPYEQNVQLAMRALDDTTRNLFEHLLKWHEEHVGWLEQQLRLIDELGAEEYIAEKL